MKSRHIIFMVVLCIISTTIAGCSLSRHVKIKSINEFGDDLKKQYEQVEGYEIYINDSNLGFAIELSEPSINSENFKDNLVLNSIVDDAKEFFSKDDIQTDFINKYKEYYEFGVDLHEGEIITLYPDVKLTIRLNESEISIIYWSSYHRFNLETNSYVIDKYKTWDQPYHSTN